MVKFRKFELICGVSGFCLLLAGCQTGPVYDAYLGIEESDRDTAGTITISSPQLYGRETLINDRRKEVEFLKKKLELVNETFTPTPNSIVRNLQDIAGTSLSLGLSYDPSNVQANKLAEVQANSAIELAEETAAYRLTAYREFLALDQQHKQLVAQGQAMDQQRGELLLLKEKAGTTDETKKAIDQQIGQLDIARTEVNGKMTGVQSRLTGLRESLGLAPTQGTLTVTAQSTPAQTKAAVDQQLAAMKEYFATPAGSATFGVLPPTVLSSSTLSDSEKLQEVQALRQELRGLIAEMELDDLHDYRGSALYRMDFSLTMFPGSGANRRKYGVMDVGLSPPTIGRDLDEAAISKLYTNWLQHVAVDVNRRLNPGGSQTPAGGEDNDELTWTYVEVYRDLGRRSEIFDLVVRDLSTIPTLVQTYVATKPVETCRALSLMLDEGKYEFRYMDLSTFTALSESLYKSNQSFLSERIRAIRDLDDKQYFASPFLNPDACEQGDSRQQALSILDNQAIWRTLVGGGNKSSLALLAPPGDGAPLLQLLDQRYGDHTCEAVFPVEENLLISLRGYQRNMAGRGRDATANFVAGVLREIVDGCHSQNNTHTSSDRLPTEKPGYESFREHVVDQFGSMIGELRVLGANPAERGQTVSTVANAMQSFQAALAVVANIPQAGASANAGAGVLDQTAASVAAMERLPRVVSYADQNRGEGHFGWVIAPKIGLEPANKLITMEQSLSNFRTSAEVSAPGWWPHLTLATDSYWVGNFNRPQGYVYNGEGDPGKFFKVELPARSVDYDGLTQFIYGDRGALGDVFLRPQIYSISPDQVSACRTSAATFVLRGKNLWRGTKVFAGGKEVSTITVLPNMEGISFELTIGEALIAPRDSKVDYLPNVDVLVATRDGTAQTRLRVQQYDVSGTTCAGYGSTPATPPGGN